MTSWFYKYTAKPSAVTPSPTPNIHNNNNDPNNNITTSTTPSPAPSSGFKLGQLFSNVASTIMTKLSEEKYVLHSYA